MRIHVFAQQTIKFFLSETVLSDFEQRCFDSVSESVIRTFRRRFYGVQKKLATVNLFIAIIVQRERNWRRSGTKNVGFAPFNRIKLAEKRAGRVQILYTFSTLSNFHTKLLLFLEKFPGI